MSTSNTPPSPDHNQDRAFVVTFSGVLLALFGIFFICLVAAHVLGSGHRMTTIETAKTVARLTPIGHSITSQAELDALKPPHLVLAPDKLVAQVCSGCHAAGTLGAPKIGDKSAWGGRFAADGGLAGLTASAIHGKGSMPPRGGNPDLTDDEIQGAIQLMLKSSGVGA